MANAGRVAIVPKGDYSSATAYKRLDLVRYNNNAYVAKKASTGVAPTDTTYWMLAMENITQQQYDDLINGTTPVGNASKLGGESAEQWQEKIDNIQTTSRATLSQAGWYRVAELKRNTSYYSGLFSIVSRYGDCGAISATFLVERSGSNVVISPVGIVSSGTNPFTKVRLTTDGTNAYFEAYYSLSVNNVCMFSVLGSLSAEAKVLQYTPWTKLDFVATSETVDGVTVTTTYDIPANAKPVNDIDLATALEGYLKNTGGTVGGNLTLRATDTATIYERIMNSMRDVSFGITSEGKFYIHDNTNDKYIIGSTADNTNTFNGTATGNLEKTGGTLGSTDLDTVVLDLVNKSNRMRMQVTSSGNFIMSDATNNKNVIFVSADGNTRTFNGVATGCLPLDGNTAMTGASILLNNGYGRLHNDTSGVQIESWNVAKDETNRRILKIYNSGEKNIKDSLTLTDRINGVNNNYTVLHTGNSAPIVKSTTAPSDTTAVWIDTANKKTKAYIDGAWTIIA